MHFNFAVNNSNNSNNSNKHIFIIILWVKSDDNYDDDYADNDFDDNHNGNKINDSLLQKLD